VALINFRIPVIFFCSLIESVDLVSGDCKVGTLKLNYFVWTKVGVSVFEYLMLQTALKISECFTFCFYFYYHTLNSSSHRVYIRETE
jgi:hypothetical protein